MALIVILGSTIHHYENIGIKGYALFKPDGELLKTKLGGSQVVGYAILPEDTPYKSVKVRIIVE